MDRPRKSAQSRISQSRIARFARGRWARTAVVSGVLALLGACGGGADTVENPVGPGGAPAAYTGPPPATADVQAFKLNVWDNLKAIESLRAVPRGGRADAAVRPAGRHQPGLSRPPTRSST